VLGSEHAGLDEAWLSSADAQVRVPMAGMADSLNVATTGALLLFEARRQRRALLQKG
jgi:RNA methyltransferase, TrmH family